MTSEDDANQDQSHWQWLVERKVSVLDAMIAVVVGLAIAKFIGWI